MKTIILSVLLASTVAVTAFAGVADGVLDGGAVAVAGAGNVAGAAAGNVTSVGDDSDGSTNSSGVKNSASAR